MYRTDSCARPFASPAGRKRAASLQLVRQLYFWTFQAMHHRACLHATVLDILQRLQCVHAPSMHAVQAQAPQRHTSPPQLQYGGLKGHAQQEQLLLQSCPAATQHALNDTSLWARSTTQPRQESAAARACSMLSGKRQEGCPGLAGYFQQALQPGSATSESLATQLNVGRSCISQGYSGANARACMRCL